MRGAVFAGHRKIELREFPDPTPGPGEVVFAIKASGLCGSDLKFYRPAPGEAQRALGLGDVTEPLIGGHEPCGVVAAVGPGVPEREARPGMRVMCHHYAGCGVCKHCRVGWSQLCPNGFVVYGVTAHGAHADYMTVPARTLVPLPDELSFATGAAISCGTGTAYNALRRMNVSGRDTLAVFGLGPVGLSAVQLGAAMGARVIALDVTPERRALASSGAEAARTAAIRATRTWGTVCFVGEGGSVTIDVSRDMIRKQLKVIGSWTFSSVIQAECARFVADRKIDVERLFTHRYTLDQAAEAYRLFDTQTTGKGVFLL